VVIREKTTAERAAVIDQTGDHRQRRDVVRSSLTASAAI